MAIDNEKYPGEELGESSVPWRPTPLPAMTGEQEDGSKDQAGSHMHPTSHKISRPSAQWGNKDLKQLSSS